MPVSEYHKTIFIHIPKTGGTSIEFALGMHGNRTDVGETPYLNQKKNHQSLFGRGLQHLSCREVFNIVSRRLRKNEAGNPFSKCIVYAKSYLPVPDRVLSFDHITDSYYVFTIVRNPYDRLVSEIAWTKGRWRTENELDTEVFRTEASKLFASPSRNIPGRFKPQHTYIMIDGKNPMHDVFYFEDFKSLIPIIKDKFNLIEGVPHRMKSNHRSWKDYYDPGIREMVYNYYKTDFELFGYES